MIDTKEHLHELIKDFRTAMLTTRTRDGGFHIRPMAVAKLAADEDLYFATGPYDAKVEEIAEIIKSQSAFRAALSLLRSMDRLACRKTALLLTSFGRKRGACGFRAERDDPNLCLLAVSPTSAEYWDSSGLEGFKYLYEGFEGCPAKTNAGSRRDAAREGLAVMGNARIKITTR